MVKSSAAGINFLEQDSLPWVLPLTSSIVEVAKRPDHMTALCEALAVLSARPPALLMLDILTSLWKPDTCWNGVIKKRADPIQQVKIQKLLRWSRVDRYPSGLSLMDGFTPATQLVRRSPAVWIIPIKPSALGCCYCSAGCFPVTVGRRCS